MLFIEENAEDDSLELERCWSNNSQKRGLV